MGIRKLGIMGGYGGLWGVMGSTCGSVYVLCMYSHATMIEWSTGRVSGRNIE